MCIENQWYPGHIPVATTLHYNVGPLVQYEVMQYHIFGDQIWFKLPKSDAEIWGVCGKKKQTQICDDYSQDEYLTLHGAIIESPFHYIDGWFP